MQTALTVGAALSAVIWIYLLVARDGFWRGGERLRPSDLGLAVWPSVVAVVPARDEADTIGECLKSLVKQDYPGDFRIIMVDDSSRDGTGDIARGVASETARSIEIVSGAPLETGWTGKLWALNQGVQAALRGLEPEFLWFTDADIAHGAVTLRELVTKAQIDHRDLVSLMVRLRCSTFWEKLLVPAFVFFFQKLYPFAAINNPAKRTAGAAGGCLLVRRKTLAAAGGIEAIRDRLIDDCALAEAVQNSGGRLWLGLADDSRSLRPYTRLGDVWDMVARTAFTQLSYSWAKLVGTVIGMVLIYLLPPLALLGLPFHGNSLAALLGATAWALMTICYVPTQVYYRLPPLLGLVTLPVAGSLYTAMTVSSAWRHLRGKGGKWKDRHYQSAVQKP